METPTNYKLKENLSKALGSSEAKVKLSQRLFSIMPYRYMATNFQFPSVSLMQKKILE